MRGDSPLSPWYLNCCVVFHTCFWIIMYNCCPVLDQTLNHLMVFYFARKTSSRHGLFIKNHVSLFIFRYPFNRPHVCCILRTLARLLSNACQARRSLAGAFPPYLPYAPLVEGTIVLTIHPILKVISPYKMKLAIIMPTSALTTSRQGQECTNKLVYFYL